MPLFSLDRDARITQVSNNWLDLFGFAEADVIEKPFSAFLDQNSARDFLVREWPMLVAKDAVEEVGYQVQASTGQMRNVIVSARVERDQRGSFLHVLGGMTDVTARHEAEAALRQAQKNEAIGHLTGGVAHDFNNLLAVIVGNLDLLERQALEPTARRFLERAMQGAQRGAALTQRLLAFARRQDLRPEVVDVAQLVRAMDDLLQRSLGPTIKVVTSFPAIMPPAHVDAHQLELAILNLVVNARDAMPEGGELRIEAATEHLPPSHHAERDGGSFVRLSIIDHGQGMDAATLARATDPFFTTKPLGKGTGLGLSMVHGLAAQSGGQLRIRSEPGAGTTVDLLLPATVHTPAQIVSPPSIRDCPPASTGLILVVDDDDLVRDNTVALLEELDYRVLAASSGEQALELLAHRRDVELVITDQLMPGMLGTQLARQLRRGAPTMAILIVSGYAELTGSEAALYPTLPKPFTGAQLAQAVADTLRWQESHLIVSP